MPERGGHEADSGIVDVTDGKLKALPLGAVTFRYWFMLGETTDPPELAVDYAQMFGATGITSKFVAVSPAVTGANEYLEVGFTSAAPTLSVFGDSGQIQLRFHGTSYSASFDLDQTTDYSFRPVGRRLNQRFTDRRTSPATSTASSPGAKNLSSGTKTRAVPTLVERCVANSPPASSTHRAIRGSVSRPAVCRFFCPRS